VEPLSGKSERLVEVELEKTEMSISDKAPIAQGEIFEFKTMEGAEQFVAEVKRRFGLGAEAFDDADAAYAAHGFFPFELHPPVVIVERSNQHDTEELAESCGGEWVGH